MYDANGMTIFDNTEYELLTQTVKPEIAICTNYIGKIYPNLQITKFCFNIDFQECCAEICTQNEVLDNDFQPSNSKFCPPHCTFSENVC